MKSSSTRGVSGLEPGIRELDWEDSLHCVVSGAEAACCDQHDLAWGATEIRRGLLETVMSVSLSESSVFPDEAGEENEDGNGPEHGVHTN